MTPQDGNEDWLGLGMRQQRASTGNGMASVGLSSDGAGESFYDMYGRMTGGLI
jgi:hypothetical protein